MGIKQYPGSRWWKFDFHNHTPASSDYNQSEISTLQPRAWLLAYMQKGIDCVAVTDHNTSDWVEKLQSEFAAMKQEEPAPDGFRPMELFPGVEITTGDSLHILAIFAPETNKAKLDGLLHGKLNISNHGKPNAELMVSESASTVIDSIHAMGGLALAAHVEMPCGLLKGISVSGVFKPEKAGRVFDDVLPKLDGLEFQSLDCDEYRHFKTRIGQLAHVAGSDAHQSEDAGSRFTWVKMSQPSFDGLRLALLDPESAIRRSDETITDPQVFPEQWISAVTLENMHLRRNGHGALKLDFNPAYNAIIGGRGSGKSTVLECLRLGLARDAELKKLGELAVNSEIWKNFEGFTKLYTNKDTPGMMLPETKICVEVVKGRAQTSQRFQYVWRRQPDGRFNTQVMHWGNNNHNDGHNDGDGIKKCPSDAV
jgi:AAA domain